MSAAASAAGQVPADTTGTSGGDSDNIIIVTGVSPDESLQALEDCLARGCPPEEDIRLSLAHAENVFIGGEYRDAEKTLRGSIKRTKGASKEFPVPVSGLHRASARVSEHLGEGKDFQLSTLEMRDTLEEGLGRDHWRALVAEIAVGDSRAKLGVPDDAKRIYERVERRAIKVGLPRIAMYAKLRQALLLQARHDATKRDFWLEDAVELLTDIRDRPLAGGEEFAIMADVMLAKIDRQNGNEGSTEALVKRYADRGGVTRPVLLYSDPLYSNEDLEREVSRGSSASARLSTFSRNEPQWIDVGFWINSDGRVEEYEVLRSAGDTGWSEQVKRHVESRRYAPVSDDAATPGFYQIERYTLTSRFADQTTGTRLRRREPVARIERLDITPENYEAPVT